MSEWIDAKKQSPKEDGRYLAFYGEVFIARYIKSMDIWRDREGLGSSDGGSASPLYVNYWRELPPKPPGA